MPLPGVLQRDLLILSVWRLRILRAAKKADEQGTDGGWGGVWVDEQHGDGNRKQFVNHADKCVRGCRDHVACGPSRVPDGNAEDARQADPEPCVWLDFLRVHGLVVLKVFMNVLESDDIIPVMIVMSHSDES